ncbi:hypothetical protein B0H14DRAFT_2569008 [Mycena olivaceomarginata]|nr:hypothetical protein B0H14DRAFT_2569008 [Mycena olivaceomarginata]
MVSVDSRFEAADDLSVSEISQYRSFFFPPSVCEPTSEIFFSVDNAAEWMTSRGYCLFQEHDPTKPPDRSFHPDRLSLKDLRGYREQVIGPAYSKNPFFGIERTKEWVLPAPFATYMQAVIKETAEQDLRGCPCERSPEVFRSASRASSSSGHSVPRTASPSSQGWFSVLRAGPLKDVQINRNQPVAALSDTAIPDTESGSSLELPSMNDLNNGQAEFFDEDMGQLEYFPSDYIISSNSALIFPLPSSAHHLGPLELHWNTAFELDPALEPNYHALGGSDYAMADYNGSGSDYVFPLPPPSPPVQPPDTSAPSGTSGPSRTRR